MEININYLIEESHKNAVNKGFWDDVDLVSEDGLKEAFKDDLSISSGEINAIGNRLMLMVGEVAEAQEGLRHNDRDNFKEELADVCIRMFDLCGGLDIDLESEILKKMSKNLDRPYLHNKLF